MHIHAIICNNELLYKMGIFETLYKKFVLACTDCIEQHDIVMFTTLLYMMTIVNLKDPDYALELSTQEPPIDCFLFKIISKVSDLKRFSLPLKKLLLLLWKVLLTLYGGKEQRLKLKNKTRQKWGLVSLSESFMKSPVHDYTHYYQDMLKRYPNYVLPVPENVIPCQDSFIRKQIPEFPPKLQPFMDNSGGLLPPFLQESVGCFEKYNYKSLRVQQWTLLKKGKDPPRECDILKKVKRLYSFLYPNLTTHLSILLRLLYNIVLTGFEPNKTGKTDADLNSKTNSKKSETIPMNYNELLENIDLSKHKQVTCKAISAILLILLEIFKIHRKFFVFS